MDIKQNMILCYQSHGISQIYINLEYEIPQEIGDI